MNPPPLHLRRRITQWVALALAGTAAGCSSSPDADARAAAAGTDEPMLVHWRTVIGGFLAPPGAPFGPPARAGTGAFVTMIAPTAVALRDNVLLVVDSGAGQVWRVDLALNTLSAIAGAPATPVTAVALGPDLAAWVHDPGSRQILRFARDGRLLQTYPGGQTAQAMPSFALADEGAALLVADPLQHQWLEYRPVGGFGIPVRPADPAGRGLVAVDALASGRGIVYVLDRVAAVIHVAGRNGQVLSELGRGFLKQPVALAVDRHARVFVIDAQDRAIKLLQAGADAQVFDAARLRVQVIGAIAVHGQFLAVADRVTGRVVIHVVHRP